MSKTSKRPHVICHMLQSIDGRTDARALSRVSPHDAYERVADKLKGDAWMCGRVTMERDFAEGLFRETPAGARARKRAGRKEEGSPEPEVHVAARAKSFAVSVDALGKLDWASGDVDGDHLICAVTSSVPAVYLDTLRERGISYVLTGDGDHVELRELLEALRSAFGIKRLVLSGGGHLNGAMATAGLIDEVSLVIAPGIDGRAAVATSYDGLDGDPYDGGEHGFRMTELELTDVKQREGGCVWLRYDVKKAARAAKDPAGKAADDGAEEQES